MINNSRAAIQKKPRDINKKHPGKTYLPRFLDDSSVENLKSSVDRELADISMYMEQERQIVSKIIPGSVFQGQWDACSDVYPSAEENSTWDVTTSCGNSHVFDGKKWEAGQQLIYLKNTNTYLQRTSPGTDGIKQIISQLETEIENAKTSIAETKLTVTELNFSLSEFKTLISAQVAENSSKILTTNQTVTDLTSTVASNKTELESKLNDVSSNLSQEMSTIAKKVATAEGDIDVLEAKWTVQADVNGKISGIEMVNNGLQSSFNILADRFTVTDGTTVKPPFSIENQKVSMSDVIVRGHVEAGSGKFTGDIEGSHIIGGDLNIGKGQAIIQSDGKAIFQNADVKGDIKATSGEFRDVIIHESCTYLGTLNVDKLEGDVIKIFPVSGSVTIPATSKNRKVILSGLSFSARGSSPSNTGWARLTVTLNGRSASFSTPPNGIISSMIISKSCSYTWNLPANQTGSFSYSFSSSQCQSSETYVESAGAYLMVFNAN